MCGCLSCTPGLGAWSTTQACALTGNQPRDLYFSQLALSPLSHTSQAVVLFFFFFFNNISLCLESTRAGSRHVPWTNYCILCFLLNTFLFPQGWQLLTADSTAVQSLTECCVNIEIHEWTICQVFKIMTVDSDDDDDVFSKNVSFHNGRA